MSIDARLSRLTPALSAQERAILILESVKESGNERPEWRNTMPTSQYSQFNHYIHLMNAAHQEARTIIRLLSDKVDHIELRQSWLISHTLWLEHIEEIGRALRRNLKEPMTESEYAARLKATRAEWVPIAELAALSAEQYEHWTDDNYYEEDGERYLTDEAWDRACTEKERELRAMVARGALSGRGRGAGLKVRMGDYDDAFGRQTGITSSDDWLWYRVVPDEEAEEAEAERRGLKELLSILDWQPFGESADPELQNLPHSIRKGLREGIAYQMIICWVEARMVEIVIDEIAGEFEGVDPLMPQDRLRLDETKARLLQLREHLAFFRMDVVLREPLEEEIVELREFVLRGVR